MAEFEVVEHREWVTQLDRIESSPIAIELLSELIINVGSFHLIRKPANSDFHPVNLQVHTPPTCLFVESDTAKTRGRASFADHIKSVLRFIGDTEIGTSVIRPVARNVVDYLTSLSANNKRGHGEPSTFTQQPSLSVAIMHSPLILANHFNITAVYEHTKNGHVSYIKLHPGYLARLVNLVWVTIGSLFHVTNYNKKWGVFTI